MFDNSFFTNNTIDKEIYDQFENSEDIILNL